MQYTSTQIRSARRADLHRYLLLHHGDRFKAEGDSLRPLDNHSLSIKQGYSGYKDFATDETGNSVDFLTRYMGYTLPEAVLALCDNLVDLTAIQEDSYTTPLLDMSDAPLELPEPLDGPYRQLFAYLISRKIPAKTIQMLVHDRVLYQSKDHNNIVFVNPERDFAEIHGSLSYGKSFHSCRKKAADRFWWFRTSPDADTAYICEAAIDAISLYLLNEQNENLTPAYYISIAGVTNQKAIDRIKGQSFLNNVILAVDNDAAGQLARDKNKDLACLIPCHKDWNDDLTIP